MDFRRVVDVGIVKLLSRLGTGWGGVLFFFGGGMEHTKG